MHHRKLALSLAIVLAWINLAQADCHIASQNRVFNHSGHQCVWATLETQARHWRMPWLYDLTAVHWHATGPLEIRNTMAARGIHIYWSWPTNNHDWRSLENASARHWPVGVCLCGTHMLILTDVTKTTVTVIDNCGEYALQEQIWWRDAFDELWDGWFVCIDPEQFK